MLDKIHEFDESIAKNECMKKVFDKYDCIFASQEQSARVNIYMKVDSNCNGKLYVRRERENSN